MWSLLEKTRLIGKLTQANNLASGDLPYNRIAETLGEVLDSNTYIIDSKGEIVGYTIQHDVNNDRINKMLEREKLSEEYTKRVTSVTMTESNIDVTNELTAFPRELQDELSSSLTTIIPIYGAGERMGTIILGRFGMIFSDNDLVLGEYSATVVGLQMMYQKSHNIEESVRQKSAVQMAIKTLSYTELRAVQAIVNELNDQESGRLVTSLIADQKHITRSVIVNALRKLESAGIIETRSLGMKGTFIRITNPYFTQSFLEGIVHI